MTSTAITAPGLSGVLRMTWLHDDLAHVLDHADIDEPSGTWTGQACRDAVLPRWERRVWPSNNGSRCS